MSTSSKDLWASALKALTESDRQQLAFYNSQDRLNILSDLQVLTENAKEQCIKKRWRFSKPGRHGETIVLRDIFNKMVVWIDMFKQIGDNAVQYDPGHAALPWAGIRFILQVAVGDIVKFDFVLEGTEYIARMIGRYAIFEDIYLRRKSKASTELENALVRLYSTILLYQSKAKSFFDQSSPKRIMRSVFVTEDEFENLAKKMTLEESSVDRCAAILDAENHNNINDSLEALSIGQDQKHAALMKLLHTIDGPILRMSSQLIEIQDHLDRIQRYEILRWLSTQPYLEYHQQIFKKALAGTGRWLLEDPIYAEWHKGSTSSLLWLHGKVGAGKSTLVSIVIEDALRKAEAGQNPPPVYFYCSRNAAEYQRSDPAAILSSIVRQLSCAKPGLPLLPPVIELYEKKGQGFSSQGLHIEESCELITKLTEHYPMTTIFIDALDECDPEKRGMLLDAIEGLLQNSSLGLLKIFLSSRDDQDIACTLREYPNLDIVSRKNSADIHAFVREETEGLIKKQRLLRNSRDKDALKTLIVDEVSRGADGMFRWASLQLEMLCTMRLDQDVRARMGRIPAKLEQLYLEIYENNLLKYPGEVGQSIISNIMKWLLCAQRQMKSLEFCTAVALSTMPAEELTKEHILDLCHNFVVFDDGLDVFRFAHLSVREFLEKRNEDMAISCHLLAAETCLLQLIGASNWSPAEAFLQRYYTLDLRGKAASTAELLGGFHSYATIFWPRHCQLIGEEGRTSNPRLQRTFLFFLFNAFDDLSPLNTWICSSRRNARNGNLKAYLDLEIYCKPEDRILFVACVYAFCEIIRVCMDEYPEETRRQGCDLAIKSGNGEVLKVLLSNVCESDIPIEMVEEVAVRMDFDTLDWVLRKSKADITTLLDNLIESHGSEKAVVEGLISKYKPSEVSEGLLTYAARFCSAGTLDSLMRQSDSAEISLGFRDLDIRQAAQNEYLEITRTLLNERNPQSALSVMKAIAQSGNEEAMRLHLSDEGRSEITSDVISASCLNRNEKVLGLLLDCVGSMRIWKEAVEAAIRNCNEGILGSLLNNGYPMSQTLVNQAAAYGCASTLRLLFDRGGLITSIVLTEAAGNQLEGAKMMRLLLAEAKDWMVKEEMTDIMLKAVRCSRLDVMELLVERAKDTLISEDVLVTATINPHIGNDLIELLSKMDWEMTEEVLEVMMSHLTSEEALQIVLNRIKDMEISGKLLLAAAGNRSFGDKLVSLLLVRVNLLEVMDPLLVEAAGNETLGLELISLLRRWVGNLNITQEVMERAAQKGSIQTMTCLLDHASTPITEAIVVGALRRNRLTMVQLLLSRAINLPVTKKMICAAARYCNRDCLSLIWNRACTDFIWTKAYTDDMTEGDTMDMTLAAIENGCHSKENLRFLLDQVENIAIGPEALISAAGKTEEALLLNVLIEHGLKLQITQEVLQAAAGHEYDDSSTFVRCISELSVNIELTDEISRAAAGSGNKWILQLLPSYYGLAEVPNEWLGILQLHDAVASPHKGQIYQRSYSNRRETDINLDRAAVVAELLDRGVEPDVPDRWGSTPLFYAAQWGSIVAVQALLSAGANPKLVDKEGKTPLTFAAGCGHYGIVEILLDLGVPTHLQDQEGDTPASIAKKHGHMRVFRLLERRRQP